MGRVRDNLTIARPIVRDAFTEDIFGFDFVSQLCNIQFHNYEIQRNEVLFIVNLGYIFNSFTYLL